MKRKPRARIALYIEPSIKIIYDETAALMGIPTSRFVAQLLNESSPAIKAMQKPLKTAYTGKNKALSEINEIQQDLLKGIEK